jgi:hypothetical protein
MKKIIIGFICFITNATAFSWNALGHELIAQIAYQHLSPHTKVACRYYNKTVDEGRRKQSLIFAAVWLDRLYDKNLLALKPMHYIDIPFSLDNTPLPKPSTINAIWAIQMSSQWLLNPNATDLDKGIALRILLHVVGDVHQPLHAATKISHAQPAGDRGGNLVIFEKNKIAPNLHVYWDRGAGFLQPKKRIKAAQVKKMAKQIAQHWSCKLNRMDMNLQHWAEESHYLAVNYAYKLPNDPAHDQNYMHMTQEITEKRIALAGCRLASLLNHLFGSVEHP